jgi:hypothetical protein
LYLILNPLIDLETYTKSNENNKKPNKLRKTRILEGPQETMLKVWVVSKRENIVKTILIVYPAIVY